MLTREVMGLLCLAILWVNTLLVVAAAGLELGKLRALRDFLRPRRDGDGEHGLHEAVVEGPSPIAARIVEQVGRRGVDPARPEVRFVDRHYSVEVRGGALRCGSRTLVVPDLGGASSVDDVDAEWPAGPPETTARASASDRRTPAVRAVVWISGERMSRAFAAPASTDLVAVLADASRARGFSRTVTAELGPGTRVYVAGTLRDDTFDAQRALLLADFDPRATYRARALLVVGFMGLALVAAAACTVLAAWPPVFGPVSTIGGLCGLAFFLGVQPLGFAVRERLRWPHRAPLRGVWRATAR